MVNKFAVALGKVAAQQKRGGNWGVSDWLGGMGRSAYSMLESPGDLAARAIYGNKSVDVPKQGGPGMQMQPPLTRQEIAAGQAKFPPKPMPTPPSPAIQPRPLLAGKPTPSPVLSGSTKATLPSMPGGVKPLGS